MAVKRFTRLWSLQKLILRVKKNFRNYSSSFWNKTLTFQCKSFKEKVIKEHLIRLENLLLFKDFSKLTREIERKSFQLSILDEVNREIN